MTSARQVKDEVINAFNDHDVRGLLRSFAAEAVYVSPEGIVEGTEQLGWYFGQLFASFPDVQLTAWNKPLLDDPAVTEYTMTGTHDGPFQLADGSVLQPTGRHIAIRGAAVSTIENGLIITERDYHDQLELYNQLGMPIPAIA
ncbi:nuclear transport factor 2 family protein [Nonomuraea sp. K274]|uniref:Nuclear transport factor 2 family protein n=1 Tax=Nonomuraea cypriaca TaxID=1187855 RepID=A0A931EYR6_9ACTN|nr:nuclear transport factor 2 family protein [Nonomuraea cypriaca]MBF8189064.1 nuclear transport factor 2 family protein [Nonomuraea cypriaca]